MIDMIGPNNVVELRFKHEAWSSYEDEEEGVEELLETLYRGEVGESWQDVTQQAADCWDWDDEGIIDFEAKSEMIETARDFVSMEFLNKDNEWELVPEEAESLFWEMEEKAFDEG